MKACQRWRQLSPKAAMAAGGTADDPRQHARQWRAVARCVLLAVPPSVVLSADRGQITCRCQRSARAWCATTTAAWRSVRHTGPAKRTAAATTSANAATERPRPVAIGVIRGGRTTVSCHRRHHLRARGTRRAFWQFFGVPQCGKFPATQVWMRRRNDDFIRFESERFGGRGLDWIRGAGSGSRCATECVSARFLL